MWSNDRLIVHNYSRQKIRCVKREQFSTFWWILLFERKKWRCDISSSSTSDSSFIETNKGECGRRQNIRFCMIWRWSEWRDYIWNHEFYDLVCFDLHTKKQRTTGSWSSFVEEYEGCINPSGKLLCQWQSPPNNMQHMDSNISYMLDFSTNPFVHLLLKSFMTGLIKDPSAWIISSSHRLDQTNSCGAKSFIIYVW